MKIWNRRFVIFLLINTAIFLSFNMSTSGFPAFVSTNSSSHITTGLVTAVSAIGALLLRPIAGYVLDHENGRFFPLMGLLFMAAPLFCRFSSNTAALLAVRFLQGAGWGLASTVCSKTIANSLPRERLSEGIGYAGFFSSVATAFAPGMAISIGERHGFGSMFSVIGFSAVFAAVVYLFAGQIKPEASRQTKENARPGYFSPEGIWIPALLIMTITMAYAPMVTFIKPFAAALGIQKTIGFFFAYAFATVIARPLTGLYVDRKDARLPTILALVSTAAASVLLFFCRSSGLLLLAGVFAGIGTGAGMNALQTMAVKDIATANRGMAMAIFLFGFDFGMAMGSFLAGIVSSQTGFQKMFLIMAMPPALACVAFSAAQARKRDRARRKPWEDCM